MAALKRENRRDFLCFQYWQFLAWTLANTQKHDKLSLQKNMINTEIEKHNRNEKWEMLDNVVLFLIKNEQTEPNLIYRKTYPNVIYRFYHSY